MIFVDTTAWYASTVPSDPNHAAARQWLSVNTLPLVTTDYVVDEVLTLLRARGLRSRALLIGEQFFAGTIAVVYRLSDEDIHDAWDVFRQYEDKDWSFTDCASRVAMERLGIETALAFDQHFAQFGTVTVAP